MKRLLPFVKYVATGNDFVIFDFFEFNLFDLNDSALIRKICDRHFGVGADGLIALQNEDGFDFRMRYFNSDGRISSFCGNGSRASVKYMGSKQFKSEFSFTAEDGPHLGKIKDDQVSVKMKDIDDYQKTEHGNLIDTGSPHLIIPVSDPWDFDVITVGRNYRKQFDPEGVNVNFISMNQNGLRIATYERGVESETLACGTGVTAAAYFKCVSDHLSGRQSVAVEAKGGNLQVSFTLHEKTATDVWLEGQAYQTFAGFYEIN